MMMAAETRFLADSMLGSLAKWLRILGYDTAYCPHLDDNGLVRLARAEERVLLTRDTGLLHRHGLHLLFVQSQALEEQLVQVLRAFGLRTDNSFSRCPVCNSELEEVVKSEAWGQVPPFVFQTQDGFRLCPECNRFYWRGTHWQNMLAKVQLLS
jgi:uncharacterized protein with PIN domain